MAHHHITHDSLISKLNLNTIYCYTQLMFAVIIKLKKKNGKGVHAKTTLKQGQKN